MGNSNSKERDSLHGLEDDGRNHSVVLLLVKNRITLFICNEPLTSRYRNRYKGALTFELQMGFNHAVTLR